jgi:hypothetical protein
MSQQQLWNLNWGAYSNYDLSSIACMLRSWSENKEYLLDVFMFLRAWWHKDYHCSTFARAGLWARGIWGLTVRECKRKLYEEWNHLGLLNTLNHWNIVIALCIPIQVVTHFGEWSKGVEKHNVNVVRGWGIENLFFLMCLGLYLL